ncbi:MAG TPA: Mrp/NBP35 family ATP-binding protein [Candidatus Dormibacteraeota bacterium]|nr:Mrp/NBP35 family ATP-binding protein [Candidatus Dormibacteraeota bacterium]
MPDISEADVLQALAGVQDPELNRDFVELGMIRDVRASGGVINLAVILTTPACPMKDEIGRRVRTALLERIPGVSAVNIEFGAQVAQFRGVGEKQPIPGVRNVIAVGSGKGGVGKSTVASNLALALRRSGASVALVDADIYGPNIPTMFGVEGQPYQENGKIVPLTGHGLKLMSIGFLIGQDKPLIWRGPMIAGTLKQFLYDVNWGELDYLVVDLPPGTGDAPLTLVQTIPITGAVLVTTPQDVAVEDVSRAAAMFKTLGVAVLGVVENMSYFLCPHCGERTEVFAHGGGQTLAEKLGVPFLGELPLDAAVRVGGGPGVPLMASAPESALGQVFNGVAEAIAGRVSVAAFAGASGPLPFVPGPGLQPLA